MDEKIRRSKYRTTLEKVKRKQLNLLFLLYCFPFTPSFLLSGAAALTNMRTEAFLAILLPAKFVMILSLAFIGAVSYTHLDVYKRQLQDFTKQLGQYRDGEEDTQHNWRLWHA